MNFSHCKILLFFVLALVLGACNPCVKSNKVEQRIIFPSYSAQYDAAAQNLTATVTFQTDNESGNYIKLSSDSYVYCDQEKMEQKTDKERPCYYHAERNAASCPDAIHFNYNNDEGMIFNNKLIIKTIQISDISLDKNQDNSIKYKGLPIDEDETLNLVLEKDGHQFELSPDVSENNLLIISASMLHELKPGDYEGHLQRTSYSTSVKAMDRGGNAVTTYCSEKYKITIQ